MRSHEKRIKSTLNIDTPNRFIKMSENNFRTIRQLLNLFYTTVDVQLFKHLHLL